MSRLDGIDLRIYYLNRDISSQWYTKSKGKGIQQSEIFDTQKLINGAKPKPEKACQYARQWSGFFFLRYKQAIYCTYIHVARS